MSRNSAVSFHSRSTNKTPYTPIFYPATGPSTTGSVTQTEIPEAYLEYLSRKHIALAQIVQESPPSRSGSPVEGDENSSSQARVEALRERVREAVQHANGDPADGRWGFVAQLLRLSTSRRRRWLGVTTQGEKAESKSGWINAKTEREWEEWEEKWKKEVHLKTKIQSWQQNVDQGPVSQSNGSNPLASYRSLPSAKLADQEKSLSRARAAKGQLSQALVSSSIRDPKDLSALGFRVVKRSTAATIKKSQSSREFRNTGSILSKTPSRSSEPIASGPDVTAINGSAITKPRPHTIQDISETSFLPPSFPDELNVSTPNTKTNQRRKPEPIAHVSEPPPLEAVQIESHQQANQGLPDPLSRPALDDTSDPQLTDSLTRHVDKRARSSSPPYAIKKARVGIAAISSATSPLPNTTVPIEEPASSSSIMITPKHAQLPKLTDLLASRKRKSSLERNFGSPVLHERSKAPQKLQIKHMAPLGTPGLEPKIPLEKGSAEVTDPAPLSASDKPVLYAHVQMSDLDLRLDEATGGNMPSPTKSLSSLAASDSDEDYENDRFEPPFTSTQAQDAAPGKATNDSGWMGYNSQLDIDGKVDMVSKFIEKDLDYSGWLKDPSEGSDGIGNE